MEATLGIFLYRYLHLKLAKWPCFSYYLLFFLQENWITRGRIDSAWKPVLKMYTHVSKCKNGKIKFLKLHLGGSVHFHKKCLLEKIFTFVKIIVNTNTQNYLVNNTLSFWVCSRFDQVLRSRPLALCRLHTLHSNGNLLVSWQWH
jgi:hypothetical protein